MPIPSPSACSADSEFAVRLFFFRTADSSPGVLTPVTYATSHHLRFSDYVTLILCISRVVIALEMPAIADSVIKVRINGAVASEANETCGRYYPASTPSETSHES